MTFQAKQRIKRAGAATKRNVPLVKQQFRKAAGQPRRAMLASVAKNLEALRTLARE